MSLDVVLRVPTSAPLDRVADFVAEVEEAGFAGVAFPDTQLVSRDAYVALALAAHATTRIKLYAVVTNPITRHVSVLACLAQTVEELAPGRLRIVLGTGAGSVTGIGRHPATITRIREAIVTLRQLLAGKTVDFRGSRSHLGFATGRPVLLLLAGRGPRILELAGGVADGVFPYVGLHRANIDYVLERVASGAAPDERDASSLEYVWDIHMALASTQREALAAARPTCAYWLAQPSLAALLRRAGLDVEDPPHATSWGEAQRLAPSLSDKTVAAIGEVIGAYGPPHLVAETLAGAIKLGVSKVYVRPGEGEALPVATLRAFRDVIFPRLAQNP